jgi:signal transduction histidine kinase
VDSRGDLWVGSAADGLFRHRNGRYEPFGEAQGLGDRLVAVIVEDDGANLWVGTARGISRLERAKIEAVAEGRAASLEPIFLDRADGLLNAEGSGGGFDPSGLCDRDGRVWLSTIDGIAVIDARTFPINQVPPGVAIEDVTLAGRPAAPRADGVIDVPAGTPALDITYTTFSMLAPGKTRFRFRLEGHETAWHDVGARRTAYYTRLPPGRYTFQVFAANNDGIWSQTPAQVRLDVLPFIWERTSVRAASLAALLAATGLLVFVSVQRRSRRKVADLERERALERERTRIARDLHDDLGSRLTHIAIVA